MDILALSTDPAAWPALVTCTMLAAILWVDKLSFTAFIATGLLGGEQARARRFGLALGGRIAKRAPIQPEMVATRPL